MSDSENFHLQLETVLVCFMTHMHFGKEVEYVWPLVTVQFCEVSVTEFASRRTPLWLGTQAEW